jgi:hypothetical protein
MARKAVGLPLFSFTCCHFLIKLRLSRLGQVGPRVSDNDDFWATSEATCGSDTQIRISGCLTNSELEQAS